MIDLTIPEKLQSMIRNELKCGESVLWMERPKTLFFDSGTIPLFSFAIPWTATSLFMLDKILNGNSGEGMDVVGVIFMTPFLLLGFGMLSCPLWNWLKSRRTVYIITDRRALIFSGLRSIEVRSFPPDKLGDTFRKEKPGGRGDVIIQQRSWLDSDNDRQTEELGFLRVKNACRVEDLLRELATGRLSSGRALT